MVLIGLGAGISNWIIVNYKPWFDEHVFHVDSFHPFVIEPPADLGFFITNLIAVVGFVDQSSGFFSSKFF